MAVFLFAAGLFVLLTTRRRWIAWLWHPVHLAPLNPSTDQVAQHESRISPPLRENRHTMKTSSFLLVLGPLLTLVSH
jgi:hypothetical protein